MYIFRSIHEIINTIFVAKGLLVEMFEKRKVLSFRYSDALALLKEDENRLKILIEKEIIHQNGNFVELDFVHVLYQGKIIKSGDFSLAKKLEEQGYGWLIDQQ